MYVYLSLSLRPMNVNSMSSLYSKTPVALNAKIATGLHHSMQNPFPIAIKFGYSKSEWSVHPVTSNRKSEDSFMQNHSDRHKR